MNRLYRRTVFLGLAVATTAACTQDRAFRPPFGKGTFPRLDMLVSTDWLHRNLDNPDVVVVHVSKTTREGYDAGHIPRARFLAWSDISTSRNGVLNELRPIAELVEVVRRLGIDANKRVVLYDENEGVHAARGYVTLDYLGLGDRAALLDGQWEKWMAERRPVTTAVPDVQPTVFVPRINPDVVIPIEQVRDAVWAANHLANAPVALIDARPPEEYSGKTPGEAVKRPGHIPGARNVFSARNVASESMPVLRPAPELRQMYDDAGAKAGDLVVTYCRTGGQGSLAYFAAKYLGYDARLYDGSFTEWSAAADTEVATGTPPR